MIVGSDDFDTERIGVDTAPNGGNSLGLPRKFKLSLVENKIEWKWYNGWNRLEQDDFDQKKPL